MRSILTRAALTLLVVLAGCAAPSYFMHPTYDFSNVKKVAVLPLENLTADQLKEIGAILAA